MSHSNHRNQQAEQGNREQAPKGLFVLCLVVQEVKAKHAGTSQAANEWDQVVHSDPLCRAVHGKAVANASTSSQQTEGGDEVGHALTCLLAGWLGAKHRPINIGAQFFAANRAGRGFFNGWAVFGGHVAALLPHAWSA